MSHSKTSDGRINMNYEGISYLCEIEDHINCGGACKCKCHEAKSDRILL